MTYSFVSGVELARCRANRGRTRGRRQPSTAGRVAVAVARALVIGALGLVVGFAVGWALFSWQPWVPSGPTEHDAEIAVLRRGQMVTASCVRREYPTDVFDCAAARRNNCPLNTEWEVTATPNGLVVDPEPAGGLPPLPPIGC
jgi:hypothetical protein